MHILTIYTKTPFRGKLMFKVKLKFTSREEAYNWVDSVVLPDLFPSIEFERSGSIWTSWDKSRKAYFWINAWAFSE